MLRHLPFLRRAWLGAGPSYLILFVTSRCHGGCGHCFNRGQLNGADDLSHDELLRVSATAGPLPALLLSGGEPFLRPGLELILASFVQHNGLSVCAIPTSGFDPEGIEAAVAAICAASPQLRLSIGVSVDGPPALNDALRYPGSFAQARATVARLVALRQVHPLLEVFVHTVVSRRNAVALPDFMQRVEGWGLDGHNLELLRNPDALPSMTTIRYLHRLAVAGRRRSLPPGLDRAVSIGSLRDSQLRKEHSLQGGSFPCAAGRQILVLDADGGLRACEALAPVGNIRDFDGDLSRAVAHLAPRAPVHCDDCTNICFINASLAASPRALLRIPLGWGRAGLGL